MIIDEKYIIKYIQCQTQCRDEKGQPVDWYVVYKLPKVSDSGPPLDTGLRYAYLSSKSQSGWTLSDVDISDETSIFGQTLSPLYAKKVDPGISYINYNDHWPNDTKKSTGAHAKGVIATDDSHGFWLIHSVPKFAAQESGHKYVYPASGETYGQTALCISYKITEIDNILDQLLYMHPNVYAMRVSTHLKSKSSKIAALSARKWSSGPMNVQIITSAGGVNFTSFSKAPGDHVDLYSQIMAPVLNTSLYVETWRQGAGHPLPSECRLKKTVENIDDISVSFVNSRLKGGKIVSGIPVPFLLADVEHRRHKLGVQFQVIVGCFAYTGELYATGAYDSFDVFITRTPFPSDLSVRWSHQASGIRTYGPTIRVVYLLGGKLRDIMHEPKAEGVVCGYDSFGVSSDTLIGTGRRFVV
ncbi:unnamed protein product, partial [Oppiella nova]